MKNLHKLLWSACLLTFPLAASADSWKDENGHGNGHRKHNEEYWDGNCKVKRKVKKDGDYKEERKCKGAAYRYTEAAPVYVPVQPAVAMPPGVTIQGTVRIPQ
jgi:hypothetical protein